MAEKKSEEMTKELTETFRETTEIMTKSIIAAQQRNMQFVQNTLTNAMELVKSHVEATHALMQELEQQQAAWQKLMPGGANQWMEAYQGVFRTPLSFYQQTLEAIGKTTQQGMKSFEKAVEDLEQAAQQPERTTHRAGKA